MLSTIGIIIDVAIVLALIISALIGLKKGFLKSVLSIFSWGVCLLIAIFSAKYVAGWINGLFDFAGLMGDKISSGLTKSNEFFGTSINAFANKEEIINNLPSNLNGLLKQLIKSVFSTNAVDMTSTETIGSFVGSVLGEISMVIISGILVFIVLKIVVALLSKLFDNIEKTKVIGGLNKILGLVLGLARAALIIIIINVVLVGLSLIPAVNKLTAPIIKENTHIEKIIYNKTDELFGKYVIEGNTVKNWIEDLWNSR
ncbi:MAG: CvpA family protein [Clostridia bacterium]|nr:CvpA family protein [Clostridia bacterium]